MQKAKKSMKSSDNRGNMKLIYKTNTISIWRVCGVGGHRCGVYVEDKQVMETPTKTHNSLPNGEDGELIWFEHIKIMRNNFLHYSLALPFFIQ